MTTSLSSPRSGLIDIRTSGREECPALGRPVMLALNKRVGVALAFRPTCKRWSCPVCSQANARYWRYVLTHGAEEIMSSGGNLFFVTITSHEALTSQETTRRVFSDAWPKLRKRVVRKTQELAFICVPEAHKNGRLHVHMLWNKAVDRAWLKDNARACGLGYMVDIRPVSSVKGVSRYASKYLTKQAGLVHWPKHFRRIRHSQDWPMPDQQAPLNDWHFQVVKHGHLARAHMHSLAALGYHVIDTDAGEAWAIVDSIG